MSWESQNRNQTVRFRAGLMLISRAFTLATANCALPRVLATSCAARARVSLCSFHNTWTGLGAPRLFGCRNMHFDNRYVANIQGRTGEVHTVAYYIGIIDFLQEWTPTKISAYMIKKMVAPQPQSTIPPGPYAEQFRNFFEHKWVGDANPVDGDSIAATT